MYVYVQEVQDEFSFFCSDGNFITSMPPRASIRVRVLVMQKRADYSFNLTGFFPSVSLPFPSFLLNFAAETLYGLRPGLRPPRVGWRGCGHGGQHRPGVVSGHRKQHRDGVDLGDSGNSGRVNAPCR